MMGKRKSKSTSLKSAAEIAAERRLKSPKTDEEERKEGAERSPEAEPAAGEAAAVSRSEKIEALQKERDELEDRLLRMAAEFDNYRKRTARQQEENVKWAAEETVRELLPMLGSFKRAMAIEPPEENDPFREGIEQIYQQLNDAFGKIGLRVVETVGHPFDPTVHEAVMGMETDEYPEGTVIEEMEEGYLLNGRLLRPAKVITAKAKRAAQEAAQTEPAKEETEGD